MNRQSIISEEIQESPVYWFVLLQSARERGDYDRAGVADRELRRLGVRVTFPRSRTRQEAKGVLR